MNNRIGNTQCHGGGHFLDAVGMQIRDQQIFDVLVRLITVENIIDDVQQDIIILIEKISGYSFILNHLTSQSSEKLTECIFMSNSYSKSPKQFAHLLLDIPSVMIGQQLNDKGGNRLQYFTSLS